MADIYVFIGPPGAGKGTVGEMFCETTKAVHVSTGDILRQEMAAGTDLGNKIKGIIAAGGLVSDDIVAEMVENRLKKDDIVANGCLLDGFPRTVPQAEALKGILQRTNHRM
ncbi:MAG: nucleoside monophosphate kinase, partial [Victivallales bacterium]|nr:nucleoside monophosphate kinase [Victivallales bacterium]